MERLFEAGALDVFFTPVYMKKCRPAVKLTFIAQEEDLDTLERIVLSETSTIGIRKIKVERTTMERSYELINTKFGDIHVKKVVYGDIIKFSGEYEDIKKAALKNKVSIKEVYDEIKNI